METHISVGAEPRASDIDPMEVRALAAKYGHPIYRCYDIETDEHLRTHRWREIPDRRGEVVFAIRQFNGEILLHTKPHYEQEIYRLPSGGIGHGESVENALFREVAEETGQRVIVRRFLGIINSRFHLNGACVSFASYVFYMESLSIHLQARDREEIAGYRTVAPECLNHVAQALRHLTGKRRYWGYWRSLPHDLVHECLTRRRRKRTSRA